MSDYTTVLTTLQQIAPEAHIAGGAVRDTILQKQIHDVDVFMKDEHVEEAAALLRSSCSYVGRRAETISRVLRSGHDARG
jgi:tRNA nucleotidyltransferase/poly(A) polymerase